MVPITKQLADGCVALIEKLHWKRISIISHEDEFYFSVSNWAYPLFMVAYTFPIVVITSTANWYISIIWSYLYIMLYRLDYTQQKN